MYKCLVSLTFAIWVSGCTTVPLTSLPKLSRIDFLTTDIAKLRVALALPQELRTTPDGVAMNMTYRSGDEPEQQDTLTLIETFGLGDDTGLPNTVPRQQALHVYKLSDDGVRRLVEIRDKVLAAKSRHQKGSLTFGIEPSEFCSRGQLPAGPLLASTYILTSETGGFVLVSNDFNLRSNAKLTESLRKLKDCP